MQIQPINSVRLYKNVPFLIDYANIVQFDSVQAQQSYFASLVHKDYNNLTYTRHNGQIIVDGNRETLLDYNYMSFTNSNYSNKTFYAFITGLRYESPNSTTIFFTIDEWQTWCFNISFLPTFVERKHCKRWNADGTPVINTIPENLEFGSEYIVKDYRINENNIIWICFVSSYPTTYDHISKIPDPLYKFYIPIYINGDNVIEDVIVNDTSGYLTKSYDLMKLFRNNKDMVGNLRNIFICEIPPFPFTWSIENNDLHIITNETYASKTVYQTSDGVDFYVIEQITHKTPVRKIENFPKYGNLTNGITESKLLMYPYSYVQLMDAQGNNFIIKPEYLPTSQIQISSLTHDGNINKVIHQVVNYLGLSGSQSIPFVNLQNGIINANANNLTIIDDYTAAYLQGQGNTIQQSIQNIKQQAEINTANAKLYGDVNVVNAISQAMANTISGILTGGYQGGAVGGIVYGTSATGQGISMIGNSGRTAEANIQATEMQGALSNQIAIASANAKLEDAKMVADNVHLQGGNALFTYQNNNQGYAVVYRQISQEYINILQDYFKKYGYKVNKVETPNLHTRQSWDYIRTIDCNLVGSINNSSLEILKGIFNNGTTVWHTTDVGNYNLSNNEI